MKSIKKHWLVTKMFTELLDIEQELVYNLAFNLACYLPETVIKKIEEKLGS
ncbi:MAG: iron dependent repressor, metal binding and dimerization domain protein [Candidatus Bathyarchaeota archaeon]|nr:iron dependent repressor, metal binding and dimerization domain protein [Candidatus Bathyarchaeum tardum]WGM89383.1 MAG: iron dependent repressor, metal binding and dimerization domain protein [Candidatus Bathyarchaeum tardum]